MNLKGDFMKIIKVVVFIVVCFLLHAVLVNASDDGFIEVSDEESLDRCLTMSLCRLTNDFDLSTEKVVTEDLVLDLNGHTILPESSLVVHAGLFSVNRGAKLTINDSKGTGKISSGLNGNVWAAISLTKDNDSTNLAELEVNGGTIEGYYYGIVGNGTRHNTKVTINDGIIKCNNIQDCTAIFQPQQGELIIKNGTISGGTGIEIRSGSLTVYNGTIEGLDESFSKMSNGSGTTTEGVGIAVAQHTTKNEINVRITGGNIRGQYAFYEWNAQKNSKEDLNKISIRIEGGNFTGLASGVKAVYSEDFTNFISGGKFNTSVSEYLTNDANVVSKTVDDVMPSSNKGIGIWCYVFFILLIGTIVFFFFKRKHPSFFAIKLK